MQRPFDRAESPRRAAGIRRRRALRRRWGRGRRGGGAIPEPPAGGVASRDGRRHWACVPNMEQYMA